MSRHRTSDKVLGASQVAQERDGPSACRKVSSFARRVCKDPQLCLKLPSAEAEAWDLQTIVKTSQRSQAFRSDT